MGAVLSLLLSLPATPLPPTRPLMHAGMVGSWTVWWGGCSYDTTFRADGCYQAHGSAECLFTGSWDVQEGELLITETFGLGQPDPDTYQTYRITVNTLTGCGHTENGMQIRMQRR
jgi:hypothetical protein